MPSSSVKTETKSPAAAPKKAAKIERIPADMDVTQLLEELRQACYHDRNVIGVGLGPRRKGGDTHHDEITLIVFVKNKLPKGDVKKDFLIPREFQRIATDVVAPFGPDALRQALGFVEGHQHSDDMSSVDWPRLHELRLDEAGGDLAWHGKVQDFGDVCVIEDDGTLVQTINGQQVVDFTQAYKLFRATHPDIYDFVTFFTDTASGMPPQGGSSWYRFVFNDTQGIGFGNFNQRASYGSNVLQGILFLNQGHFPFWRYVMLQEQGHRWGSFARYRDAAGGANQNDHMLNGWGHWALNFDDDKSPMDYDIYDWVANGANFSRIALDPDERVYCNLDLYLMGLLGHTEVGDFNLLSNVVPIGGNQFTADRKRLAVQNIIWAEGPRNPGVATSQKLIKNSFVVLTKDLTTVHDLVDRVDSLRLSFEDDYYEATKTLGRVDTTIGPLRVELIPSEVRQLTSQGYTTLHRHLVRPNDLRITGTQFAGRMVQIFSLRQRSLVELWFICPTSNHGSELDHLYDRSRSRIAFRSRLFSSSNCLYSALISGFNHPNSHRRIRVMCSRRAQQGSTWRLMPLFPDMNEEVHPDVPGIQSSLPDTDCTLARQAADCRYPGAVAPRGSDPYTPRWHT